LQRLLTRQRQGNGEPGASAPGEEAAWLSIARVLLNLDEFITRE
jgi:hypothetical protein